MGSGLDRQRCRVGWKATIKPLPLRNARLGSLSWIIPILVFAASIDPDFLNDQDRMISGDVLLLNLELLYHVFQLFSQLRQLLGT